MRYFSVCSGIEAVAVAWRVFGWRAVGFSEVDPFASAVLAHRYPDVPNRGDISRFEAWPDDGTAFDILAGGTPCQSFSLAGNRRGMDDARGDLARVYVGIARRYRPRWLMWENVPGVLSSGGGATSAPSSLRWLTAGTGSHIECSTLNTSACPNSAAASSLWDIAETGDPLRPYYLSPAGIAYIARRTAAAKAKGNGFGVVILPRP